MDRAEIGRDIAVVSPLGCLAMMMSHIDCMVDIAGSLGKYSAGERGGADAGLY